jgi:hypothetical protein
MRIIGCDLHARQQTLAMLDTVTGEVVKTTLKHEGNNVREFYSNLQPSTPGTCGNRSHEIHAVVCKPHGRTGNRMSGWPDPDMRASLTRFLAHISELVPLALKHRNSSFMFEAQGWRSEFNSIRMHGSSSEG